MNKLFFLLPAIEFLLGIVVSLTFTATKKSAVHFVHFKPLLGFGIFIEI